MKNVTSAFVFLLLYVASFGLLVRRGRNPDFDGIVAFRYATDDNLNRVLGVLFAPLYALGRRFGFRMMGPPFRSLR